MKTFKFRDKTYEIDHHNFLIDDDAWDENFSEGMAQKLNIHGGLSKQHWKVIKFIRNSFEKSGFRPGIYETCKETGMNVNSLKQLFPSGYLRGACLMAGVVFKRQKKDYHKPGLPEHRQGSTPPESMATAEDKTYRIDVYGYLVNPSEWDEDYAINRAYEMGIKNGLTDRHWKIIRFLQESYYKNGLIPKIYECCNANQMDIEDLVALFPAGYHRGAIKIAGLPYIMGKSTK